MKACHARVSWCVCHMLEWVMLPHMDEACQVCECATNSYLKATSQTHTHAHTRTHIHTHTHTHTNTHTHMDECHVMVTHTHTHTNMDKCHVMVMHGPCRILIHEHTSWHTHKLVTPHYHNSSSTHASRVSTKEPCISAKEPCLSQDTSWHIHERVTPHTQGMHATYRHKSCRAYNRAMSHTCVQCVSHT